MKSLKLLFEMFMPEARFPDEKFWNKDGSAIHPDPKGPPKGTVGKTHADLGSNSQEHDDLPGDSWYSDEPAPEMPSELRGHKLTGISVDDLKRFAPDSYDPTWMDPNSPDYEQDTVVSDDFELLWDHTAKKPVVRSDGKYHIWHGAPGDDFHDWVPAL